MRIVVDTNVFVGACIGRGASWEVIAVAGRAGVAVTNNLRDFRNPELKFNQPRIITPQAMLSELKK